MMRPEDLNNRAVTHAPTVREVEAEDAADPEAERSVPGAPCPPLQPATVEHAERQGGTPDRGDE